MQEEQALQPQRHVRAHRVRPLTLHALRDLETKSPQDVLMRLASDGGGLDQLVREMTITRERLLIFLSLLLKSFIPVNLQACHQLIRTIIDKMLQNDFVNFTVLQLLMENAQRSDDENRTIVAATLALVYFALIISPKAAYYKVHVFPDRLREKLRDVNDEGLKRMLENIDNLVELHRPGRRSEGGGHQGNAPHGGGGRGGGTRLREDQDRAGETFRELSLFPTPQDLTADEEIFVRRSRDSGRYDSLEDYLDVVFRLFRADFILPLRESIEKYIGTHTAEGGPGEAGRGVRVYRDVQIMRPVCTNTELAYRIAFDVGGFAGVDWRSTQRLKYGSLLCLSSDNFNTYLCATVKEHDAVLLSNGLVDVVFILQRGELARVTEVPRDQRFVMVESPAYFEAYRHVLQGLQNLNDHNFPFIRYIVECEKTINPPLYLRTGQVKYDFRPLLDDKFIIRDEKDRVAAALADLDLEDGADVDADDVARSMEAGGVEVMSEGDWPAAEDLKLDETQNEALHNALTREFALVQGPPGTGKTYLGLKILKMLLHNSAAWSQAGEKRPMLIVCYTNHALDQFLEGVLDFFQGSLVRVGGRSSSDRLIDKNLTNYRKRAHAGRKVPMEVHEAKLRVRMELQKLSIAIHEKAAQLEIVEQEIVKEDVLKEFIIGASMAQLKSCLPRGRRGGEQEEEGGGGSAILKWLKLESIHERLQYQAEHRLGVLPQYHLVAAPAAQRRKPFPPPSSSGRFSAGGDGFDNYYDDVDDDEDEDEDDGTIDLLHLVRDSTMSRKLDVDDEDEDDLFDDILELEDLDREETESEKLRRRRREMEAESRRLRAANVALDITGFCEEVESVAVKDRTQQKASKEKDREVEDSYRKLTLQYKRRLQAFLRSLDKMTMEEEEQLVTGLWKLKIKDRWRLYRLWTDLYCRQMRGEVRQDEEQYFDMARKYREILDQEDRVILESQTIIGMTTTGAARYQGILQTIGPRVIVVEEAAEVFEAHVVATLSAECQHLILIGDHKQLRPSPTVHELARKGNLDVSLFERMVSNGLHVDCLGYQHRMRPEISRMMTLPELYPKLRDHAVVKNRPDVKGVRGNVFYISHSYAEDRNEETKSFSNPHEASFLAALCAYLLKQGYQPEQITILTPYSGQIRLLGQEMPRRTFDGVRVSSVDNYQGEENDIVLLSLVRSNEDNDIGFLKFDNRICVALSRAKLGLYVVGNFEVLQRSSNLLQRVVDTANAQGILGSYLPLACQNHPNKEHGIRAATAEDFKKAPEGGCGRRCEVRLPCGHTCAQNCHTAVGHEGMRCPMPCARVCGDCGQRCQEKHVCSEHRYCMQFTEKVIPRCQHLQMMPCGQDPRQAECQAPCKRVLACGHPCQRACGQPCSRQCPVKVTVDGAPCGHRYEVSCGEKDSALCTQPCGQELVCGHTCTGTCGECRRGRLHVPCTQSCRKILVCGHDCRASCCQCPPCPRPCQNRCAHNFCSSKCGDRCVPCAEPCRWRCAHQRCSLACSEPCNRQRCDQPCTRKLPDCGHPCPGLCGEPCPPYCPVCMPEYFDDLLWGDHEEDNRYIFLEDCCHVVEVKFLDRWVDKSRNFQTDTEDANSSEGGASVSEGATSGSSGGGGGGEGGGEGGEESGGRSRAVKFPECPKCKTAIRRNLRYGNVIKEALTEMEIIKQRCCGDSAKVEELKEKVDNARRRVPHDLRPKVDGLFATDQVVSEQQLATQFYQIHTAVDANQLLRQVSSTLTNRPDMGDMYRAVEADLQHLVAWTLTPRPILSDQELFDVRQETHRLKIVAHLLQCRHTIAEDDTIQVEPRNMRRLAATIRQLMSGKPVAENDLEEGRQLQEELKEVVPDPFSALSDQEREEIVRAVSLPTGSWYACPRGHYYVIGECGRPMQESSCPECHAVVGGENHTLAERNRHAPEFDNAEGPRWSQEEDERFARMLQMEEWENWQ